MPEANPAALSDDDLLDRYQRAAFGYFLENVNPDNGLVADTSRPNSPASIAVVGFALSCYPIGVERGWMTRAAAAELTLAALRFFSASPKTVVTTSPAIRVSTTTSSTCAQACASGVASCRWWIQPC